MNGTPTESRLKKQIVIALSFADSEYFAQSECAKQLSCMLKLFRELVYFQPWRAEKHSEASTFRIDSTSAILLPKNE